MIVPVVNLGMYFSNRGFLKIRIRFRIFLPLFFVLVNLSFGQNLVDSEGPEIPSLRSIPKRSFTLSSGNGIEYGKGRRSYDSLRLQDSVMANFRQKVGQQRFSESIDISTGTNIQSRHLVEGNMDGALKYSVAGFSLSTYAGLNISNFIYNSFTRQEITDTTAKLNLSNLNVVVGAQAGKQIYLDADSTWSINTSLSYNGFLGAYHTLSLSLSTEKDWDDFMGSLRLFGSQQKADQQKLDSNSQNCSRLGKKGNCLSGANNEWTRGLGGGLELDWNPGKHLVSIGSSLDFFLSHSVISSPLSKKQKVNSLSIQRTWTNSIGYTYSASSWLDIGAYGEFGKDLDAKSSSTFWRTGASFSLTY